MRTPTTELQTMATMAQKERPIFASCSMVDSSFRTVTWDLRIGSELCIQCWVDPGKFSLKTQEMHSVNIINLVFRRALMPVAQSVTANVCVTWMCWVVQWDQLSKDYFLPDKLFSRPRCFIPADSLYGTTYILFSCRKSRLYSQGLAWKVKGTVLVQSTLD